MAENKIDPRAKSSSNPVYYVPENSPAAPQRFDTRVRLLYGARGFVTQKDLGEYWAELPDDSAYAEYRPMDLVLGDESSSHGESDPNSSH